ncbi:hypothetical protein [Ferribacterium limneticum]|uniref:hypothetical protein n=1 Tax=Ferribacterium limneticum TaxID=76259 RepID=UPI001CF86B69|nr:hypothetical protein [Ferribacterium limneticum]UCV22856.1 hypothetical protein KI613_20495 [Ferribacterium limneticum]
MKTMTMQETADYLETASIEHTHDIGHAVVHIGTSAAGVSFVLVNDLQGQTIVVEAM